jgi:protease I
MNVLAQGLRTWRNSMGTALKSASGGTWVDEQVVVCGKGPNTLVTSRRPQDLPAFCDTLTRVFGEATG